MEDYYLSLDKAIGKQVDRVTRDQVVEVLEAFYLAPFKREKLFILFQRKVKQYLKDFTMEQRCKLAGMYA